MTTAPRLGPLDGRAPEKTVWDGHVPDHDTIMLDPHGWARLLAPHYPVLERTYITWILRFDLVETYLKHPGMRQFGVEIMHLQGVEGGALYDWWEKVILTANGKRHKRLRAPLQRTFSFPLIARMRPQIRSIVRDLISEIRTPGIVDFDTAFASELPVRAICAILGVPPEDIPAIKLWTDQLSKAFGQLRDQDVGAIDQAVTNLSRYVEMLVADRRETPQDDFLTDFITTIDQTHDLSDDEMTAQILGLIFAGSDTTRTALSVAVTLLLQHRDQWEMLVRNRELIKNAVDESLRFEPTVGSLPRIAVRDLEIEGVALPKGTIAVMNIAAAQRDPARYKDPDRFDITRTDLARGSIGFGGGAHRCLGEALARTELEEALDALADHFPHMELEGDLPYFEALATGIRRLSGVSLRV